AVAEQSADPVGALEDRHVVAGARELLRASEAGRARADDRDLLPGLPRSDLGSDPALLPGVIDDLLLDLLDGHRVVVDAENTRFLARSRTDPTGELGEVVRRVEADDRLLPAVAIDQVVPVGDDVPERAALVAEGDAAVHATRRLGAELLLGKLALE